MSIQKAFLILFAASFVFLSGCTRITNAIRGTFTDSDTEVAGADPYRYKPENKADYSREDFPYEGYCIESCDLLKAKTYKTTGTYIPYVEVADEKCIRMDVSGKGCCASCASDCPSVFVYVPEEGRVIPIEAADCTVNPERKVYISKKRLCRMRGGC